MNMSMEKFMLIFLNNNGGSMSAFLGPIHFWLYNKIKIQNKIVEDILDLQLGISSEIRERINVKYGDGELKPLNEVIDEENIHKWLQNQISNVEYKLAESVTEAIKNEADNIEDIKEVFKLNGERYSPLDKNSGIEEAFKAINDTLLDGMPCDHINAIVKQDKNEAVWKRYECVHCKYWDEFNSDVRVFYILRDEFIKGLLHSTNIKYKKLNDTTYKILRIDL